MGSASIATSPGLLKRYPGDTGVLQWIFSGDIGSYTVFNTSSSLPMSNRRSTVYKDETTIRVTITNLDVWDAGNYTLVTSAQNDSNAAIFIWSKKFTTCYYTILWTEEYFIHRTLPQYRNSAIGVLPNLIYSDRNTWRKVFRRHWAPLASKEISFTHRKNRRTSFEPLCGSISFQRRMSSHEILKTSLIAIHTTLYCYIIGVYTTQRHRSYYIIIIGY